MRILLTGGNGFIGKNIIELLGKKYEILAPKRAELNLLNKTDVFNYLKENKPNIIIHAATVGGNRKINLQSDILKNNLIIFFNLLSAKQYFERMIVLGSGAEYDKRENLQNVSEINFGKNIPVDEYGLSKFIMSKFAEKVDFITHLRLFGVFGKYEDYETRFISNTICKALLDMPIKINQDVYFDYIYINDLIMIIDRMIEKKPAKIFYNIGSGNKINLKNIAQKILELTNKNLSIEVEKEGLNNEYTCDTNLLHNEIKNIQITNFDQSLNELINYYKKNIYQINKHNL